MILLKSLCDAAFGPETTSYELQGGTQLRHIDLERERGRETHIDNQLFENQARHIDLDKENCRPIQTYIGLCRPVQTPGPGWKGLTDMSDHVCLEFLIINAYGKSSCGCACGVAEEEEEEGKALGFHMCAVTTT